MDVAMETLLKVFLGSVTIYFTVAWIRAVLTVVVAMIALRRVSQILEDDMKEE